MASAVIGALRANLSLNTAEFQSGVRNAKRSLGDLQSNMARIGQAAGAVAAGLGVMAMSSINAANEVNNLSKLAGTTPAVLQKWSAATKTVGVDQEKLANIIKDGNEKIGEFLDTGGGDMKDFFTTIAPKVGVTADQFAKLSGPEGLLLLASSLEKAGVGHKVMTKYMEAYASDAMMLTPLLRNNAAELKRLGDQAEASGAIMSDSQIMALKSAGLAIGQVKQAWAGMQNSVSATLAPTIERVALALAAAMREGGALNKAFTFLADNIQRLATYVAAGAAGLLLYRGYMIASAIATAGLSRALGFLKGALVRTGLGILIVALGEAVHQFMLLAEATGSAGEAFEMLVELGKSSANAIIAGAVWMANRYIGVYRGAFMAIKEIWRDFPAIIGAAAIGGANLMIAGVEKMINGVIKRVNSLADGINWALSKLPKSIVGDTGIQLMTEIALPDLANPFADQARDAGNRAADAFKDGFGTDTFDAPKVFDVPGVKVVWKKIRDTISGASNEAAESVAGINEELFRIGDPDTVSHIDKAKEKTDELSDAAKTAKSAMSSLRDTMASAFASALTGAKSLRASVADLLSNLASMAANSAFQKLIFGLAGSGVNGSGSGATPSILGQASSWLLGGIGQNANGTDNWKGGLSWVGERGPELMNVPRGTSIYNAAESKRMAQGGSGTLRILIDHSEGSVAKILENSANQSVQIMQSGLQSFSDNALPDRVQQIANDPRRKG